MKDKTVSYVVVGIGVVAVVGGVYNLVTLPEIPETGNGFVGALVQTVGEDYRRILEWMVRTSVVNSVVLTLLGVALILVGFNMNTEKQ